jgi:hypothetical protein
LAKHRRDKNTPNEKRDDHAINMASQTQMDQLAAAIPAEFHMISVSGLRRLLDREGFALPLLFSLLFQQRSHVVIILFPAFFYFFVEQGSQDRQTSADVFNVGNFQLPNPSGST